MSWCNLSYQLWFTGEWLTVSTLLFLLFQGYKVYYTTNPQLPIASWESQMVDVNHLTTISGLTPLTTYTIRVQAFTSVGPGPLSTPALVKTQQGVPSQPINLRVTDFDETSATLQWGRPVHSSENIVSYELYWNDTYANVSRILWTIYT